MLRLWHILLIAFLVRLALPIAAFLVTNDAQVFYAGDTQSYMAPAEEFLETGRFAVEGVPEIIRTPGYPIFLLPGLMLNSKEIITILLQVIIGVFTTYLVFCLTQEIFKNYAVSKIAMLFFALEPLSVLYGTMLLTETVFTFFIIVFIFFLFKYFNKINLLYIFFAALALAASTYVRPITYYLPIPIAIGLFLWSIAQGRKWKRILGHALFFLLVSFGCLVPWQIRNALETGYRGFAAITPIHLYFHNAAALQAKLEGKSYYQVRKELGYMNWPVYFQNHPNQRDWTRDQILNYLLKESLRTISQAPGLYSTIHIKGMGRVLLDPGGAEYLRLFQSFESAGMLGNLVDKGVWKTMSQLTYQRPLLFWLTVILGLWLGLLYILAVRALLVRSIWKNQTFLAFLGVCLYLLVLSGGPAGLGRYRVPIMPFVCILSGFGAWSYRTSEKFVQYSKYQISS